MPQTPFTDPSAAALYRRAAIKLVPFLLGCYIIAMVDRLNVGYAKLQFMKDLNFDEAVFGMAAGILYIGYILFEVPSNLLLERVGLRVTLLRIMAIWGICTMALSLAATKWGFYGARFMIGAAEAGFFPGILFYLTLWFPNAWRGRITSIFAMAVPVSGVIAAPVSAWVMQNMAGVGGMRGWQWLFIVEGLPAILLGVAAWFYLPDRPANARFFSEAEKETIARDLESDASPSSSSGSFAEALRSARTYILALVYFAFYSAQSVLLLWVPTLLKNSGVASLSEIGWRSAAVFLTGAVGMALVGYNSDRVQERRWHLVTCGLVASAMYLALPLAAHNPDATCLLLMVAAVGIFSFLALFWTIPTAVFGKGARAGGIALVSSIGASGSALAPAFMGWTQVLTGSLFGAVAVLAVVFAASMIALWLCAPSERSAAAHRGSIVHAAAE